jgi:DNA-dependent RNA polymerase auxiliary subunit epsilon
VVEKSARTIASELPVLFQGDPFQPEPVREHTERVRVTGEVAQSLRKILEEKWNFTSNFWDPLTPASPVEVVFLNGMEESKKAAVVEIIRTRAERPLYLLDCEEGLFEISPEQIFSSPHEGMVFDAGFNWVVYFSHHYTITFSGDWLLEAVKSLYAGQEERLNSW